MSNQEILTKAITKAIAGGWENGKELLPFEMTESLMPDGSYPIKHLTLDFGGMALDDYVNVEAVIYDKDFAKALWGESKIPASHEATDEENTRGIFGEVLGLYSGGGYEGYGDTCKFDGTPWQFHLQQMVIADDPIAYLGKNI